ncbi:TorF family putative porin [Undibacterium sp. Jales W-56]|uniref:TorF family putative porin n=1 Tax=Undibacterium sp. Jales W-56 TaxID=2897325 RepID=UPI0021D3D0AD|nr:TorF family putative porin [Undibacterium sp. Jales W-56]MCU6434025.1 TorF family putative porin [Undibacterium sp. Jales W-56]
MAEVRAQISGSVAVTSDYVYRGVSLNNEKPALQLNLTFDGKDGWYLGGFASQVALGKQNRSGEQLIGYAGYARQLPSGLIWELGATQSVFPKEASLNYKEVFATVSFKNISGRLYYSPDYLGYGLRTAYLDISASYPMSSELYFFSHIGLLKYLSEQASVSYPYEKTYVSLPDKYDTRLGVGWNYLNCEFQLAWHHLSGDHSTDSQYKNNSRNSLVFKVVRAF